MLPTRIPLPCGEETVPLEGFFVAGVPSSCLTRGISGAEGSARSGIIHDSSFPFCGGGEKATGVPEDGPADYLETLAFTTGGATCNAVGRGQARRVF